MCNSYDSQQCTSSFASLRHTSKRLAQHLLAAPLMALLCLFLITMAPLNAAAPDITTCTLTPALVGQPCSRQLTSTDATATWAITNGDLTAGLSLNTATGVISGSPSASGTATFTVTATNADGASVGRTLSLRTQTEQPVKEWGNNSIGQNLPPENVMGVVSLAVGGNMTLALKSDGTTAYWPGPNPMMPENLSGITQIIATFDHFFALRTDGTVVGWGPNQYGQTNIPVGLSGVTAIAASLANVIVLKHDGTISSWGDGPYINNVPVGLNGIKSIAASVGGNFALALKNDGTVVQWGYTASLNASVPASLTNVKNISAGINHALALKGDGTIVGWGTNSNGQLTIPTGLSGVVSIAAGDTTSVALKGNGSVVAWGSNNYGQITVPTNLNGVTTIAAGPGNTAALGTIGSITMPPVVFGSDSAVTNLESVFSYQIIAHNSPTNYLAVGLPSGLSCDTNSGLISGTPLVTGEFLVSLSASNATGTGTATLLLSARPALPVITSPLTVSAVVNIPFSYQIAGTNNPTAYGATSLPAGLSINGVSGLISGTPTTRGSSSVLVSITNAGGTSTATLSLSVNNPAPVITSALSASATISRAFSYQITATNSPTSYSAVGLPAGLTVNTSTGRITGSPSVLGTTNVTIKATRGTGEFGTAVLVVTVYPLPPVITSALSASVVPGLPFSYQITATNSPDSYSATGLPVGLTLNAATGLISGTTASTSSANVTINAYNFSGWGTAQALTLVFPPIMTSAATVNVSMGVTVGTSVYRITATNSPTLFSATGLPPGLAVNSGSGYIYVSDSGLVAGTSTAIISASNASGTASANLAITMMPLAPVLTSNMSAAAMVGQAFSYQITATNNPTSYSATNLPSGLSLNTASGLISGPPSLAGTASIPVTATNAGGTASGTLVLTVNKGIPVITWSNPASIVDGTALSATQLNATADIAGTFTYSPAVGTVLNVGTQTLSSTFSPTDAANYDSASATVSIVVVSKTTPVITWSNPASIVYGTALSATQLNATADVAGSFDYSPATGTILNAGSQTLSASFSPTDTANYTTASATTNVVVSKATPVITWANSTSIGYGTALSATQLNATADVAGTFTYSPAVDTVLNAGTQTLSASFSPTDAANYESATATASIVVNKVSPVITWANPASIVYGSALSATQLNAAADVAGSFTYSPAVDTVLNAGTQTLSASFSPADAANYESASATTSIEVTKVSPVITWANPTSIVYGTVLSATQLNATAYVAGTFTYSPAVGTLLNAGTQTLSASFSPTDTANYESTSATVSIEVTKAPLVITWANPASIVYGTALSAAQLNATANVSGNFEYSPALGAVLNAGTQTLGVYFAPADTANYEPAAVATVSIVVSKATPVITWANPASIGYGSALSAAQLNATADVAGSFDYSPATGTVLNAGTQTLSASFSPTNATNYESASATASVVVTKTTPVITWANPASISYGMALSATQLNATADVAGMFTYSPAADTVLNAGTHILSASFSPADAANYDPASATVNLTVNALATHITWADPADITYGTALSVTQLNATANVPGTFIYTPDFGSIINAGLTSLSVQFLPTDAVNYQSSQKNARLFVNQAASVVTWSNPSNIVENIALSETQLNATANVAGTFDYSPAAGTTLTAGTHTLSVTFTPTNAVNYTTVTSTATLIVNQLLDAGAQWPALAAIEYGTPVTASILTASANVPGTFIYSANLSPVIPRSFRYWRTTMAVNSPNELMLWNEVQFFSGTQASGNKYTVASVAASHPVGNAPAEVLIDGITTESQSFGTFAALRSPVVGKYFQFDLGAVQTVGSMKIFFFRNSYYVTNIHLDASNDGVNWLRVADNIPVYPAVPPATVNLNAPTNLQLNLGTYSFSAQFLPQDAALYAPATVNTSLTVNPSQPHVTWSLPASIVAGTALSEIQLNASANVGGTFTYNPAAGTVMPSGTHTLNVTFTPSDTLNYTTATSTTTLVVNQLLDAGLQWPLPAAIEYGTPLTASTLNGTANVPGTFAYSAHLTSVQPRTFRYWRTVMAENSPNELMLWNEVRFFSETLGSGTMHPVTSVTASHPVDSAPASILIDGSTIESQSFGTFAALRSPVIGKYFQFDLGSEKTVGSIKIFFFRNFYFVTSIHLDASNDGVNWLRVAHNANVYPAVPPATVNLNAPTNLILEPGIYSFSTQFFPQDISQYVPATVNASLTVNPGVPHVTWALPDDIVYGTALSNIQLDATAAIPGTFSYSPGAGTILNAGTAQTLSVTFTPQDSVRYLSRTLTTQINVAQLHPIVSWSNPSGIVYGTALSATQLNATANVAGSFAYTPVAGTIVNAGIQTLSAVFNPTDAINYTSASATASIVVAKATPVITWTNPTNIAYGTALSAAQLNATANVAGSFTYSPAAGAILNAGTHTVSATFIPTDITNYNSTSATANVVVTKATPVIAWENPASMVYSTALSVTQLNASTSVAGNFTYTPASGTILNAGTQLLGVSFSPSDADNYESASATASIVVTKATPIVTWTNPSSIVYGTAMSATQLNATANVAGNFAYTPAAGTILNAGAQTLSTTFSPSNADNYNTVISTTTIIVAKATPVISWTNPNSIVYGTALSAAQLNATANIAGTIVYSPAIGTVLNVGNQILSATFSPTDAINYTSASATTNIVVNKATPVISWATPAAISYGTALSTSQLNATANTTGSFTFNPSAGTILTVGSHQVLNTTFVPADALNYTSSTQTVYIDVVEIRPSISVVATDANASEVTTDTGVFTFARTGSTASALTVNFMVSGTAASGTDYTTLGTTVIIPAGSASVTKTLTAVNDTLVELDETVLVTIPSNAAYVIGAQSSATVTIADNEAPVISLVATDASAGEQSSDQGVVTFTRAGNKAAALTVKFTVTGTASTGTDYAAIGTSVLIPAGVATVTKIITPVDDAIVEDDETVIVTLAAGTGYALNTTAKTGTVTILENELPVITLAATDALASEPGTDKGTFTFTRTGRKAPALVVNLQLSGTATNGVDYTMPASVNFASGIMTATAVVSPLDDTVLESDETVIASIAAGTGYAIGAINTATVKIIDNEKPLVTVVATDALASENAGDTGLFTFTRVGSTNAALTLAFAMSGTATSASDYTALGTSVIIPAGATSVTKTLIPVNNTVAENDEVATLTLVANAAYVIGTPNAASVTIIDNEIPLISLAATDTAAAEAGSDPGIFTVTRTGTKNAAVTVNFAITGTATAGTDYAAIGTSVVIPAGASSATVTIVPVDDAVVEDDETVILTLAAGTGYTASTTIKTGTVTIVENELPLVSVAATDAAAAEPSTNRGTFTFTRIGRKALALTVSVITTGTATKGTDYVALPTSVVIPAGALTATLVVTPVDNTIAELDETVIVNVVAGSGYLVGSTSSAAVTIGDNEAPVLQISPAIGVTTGAITEGDPATGAFTITRLGLKTAALTVKYTVSGTATSGIDFTALPVTTTLPANVSLVTIPVTVINDAIAELTETLTLTVVTNTGYTVGTSNTASINVVDNDAPVLPIAIN